MSRLPADGAYYVHIGDTARQGGKEHAYRLRLSAPQPDFELRATPSSVRIRTNSTGAVTVFAQRKDGFTGSIKVELKDPPEGFSAVPVQLAAGQNNAVLTVKGPSSPREPIIHQSAPRRMTGAIRVAPIPFVAGSDSTCAAMQSSAASAAARRTSGRADPIASTSAARNISSLNTSVTTIRLAMSPAA